MKFLQHFPIIKVKKKESEEEITIEPKFNWSKFWNKNFEKYWIIIYNEDKIIYKVELIIKEKDIDKKKTIPVPIDIKEKCKLMIISDTWIGAEELLELN